MLWLLILAMMIVLSVEVVYAFHMIRETNDETLQSVCTNGPSVTLKQGIISGLIGGLSPLPHVDIPGKDLTVTAQLLCEQSS